MAAEQADAFVNEFDDANEEAKETDIQVVAKELGKHLRSCTLFQGSSKTIV